MEIANQHCTGWETATESSMVSWREPRYPQRFCLNSISRTRGPGSLYGASTS